MFCQNVVVVLTIRLADKILNRLVHGIINHYLQPCLSDYSIFLYTIKGCTVGQFVSRLQAEIFLCKEIHVSTRTCANDFAQAGIMIKNHGERERTMSLQALRPCQIQLVQLLRQKHVIRHSLLELFIYFVYICAAFYCDM